MASRHLLSPAPLPLLRYRRYVVISLSDTSLFAAFATPVFRHLPLLSAVSVLTPPTTRAFC